MSKPRALRRRIAIAAVVMVSSAVGLAQVAIPVGAAGSPTRELRPVDVFMDRPYTKPQENVQVRGTRSASTAPLPQVTGRERRAAQRAAAIASSVPVIDAGTDAPNAAVTTSFSGLDRPGSANNGFLWVPPDTIVGKSATHVLEATNSAIRLSTTAGAALSTMNLNSFFGAAHSSTLGSSDILFDPKIYFDRNATNHRMIAVGLQRYGNTDATGVSRAWMAISRSSDPSSLAPSQWCRYQLNTKFNAGTSLSSWGDYPQLGAGADALVLGLNQFTFVTDSMGNPAFTYDVIRTWNKNVAYNNAVSCPSLTRYTFRPASTSNNFDVFTLQPAQEYTNPSSFTGTTNPVYFLSTIRRTGSFTTYRVWRLRNVGSGSPSMTTVPVDLTGTAYAFPPTAPQPGTAVRLSTGDDRVLQVAGLGNTMSGVHGTSCQFTASTAVEACNKYIRINVGQNASGALTASIAQQITWGGGDDIFYFMPSIAVNNAGSAAVSYQRSSASLYLSARWAFKTLAAALFTAASYSNGTCPQTISPPRTGDYSGAQTDPSDATSFWLAGERAITLGGSCQWSTTIVKVVP